MKLIVVTSSDNGPLDREALVLADEMESEITTVERLDWDDESSDPVKALYDLYQSPAVLLTQDNGSLLELWQDNLPSVSELKYRSGSV